MALLLKSLKGDIWKGESVDYPQIVFDSIKDNPSYLDNILSQQLSEGNNWLLSIFSEFVLSLWDTQIFGDVLARVLAFFCVELQHERFKEKRPVVTEIGMKVRLNMGIGKLDAHSHLDNYELRDQSRQAEVEHTA